MPLFPFHEGSGQSFILRRVQMCYFLPVDHQLLMRGKNTATTKPPSAKPKRATKQSKKLATTPGVGDEASETVEKGSQVQWGDSRTDRLIEWLEDNPEDCQKLFSDSSHDTKKENRLRRMEMPGFVLK
ncbi:hypothetical protein EDB89DRAFT_2125148 [Lactarius sanguifluus]|nr:hypothetical protein EDB89DRAFT_2125148 [Lactarius sanguifluus]